ncbi:leukocyte tyrosine kinase receptor [Patella vulgata]|uniref:leukocyte tyrosine kinase receptor n=1 Tax=Patella vulgata TaxID=6465 RepID=UPI0024A9B0D8|nr:leukocyte tyrosine kinase receptor [Patella vulgata]
MVNMYMLKGRKKQVAVLNSVVHPKPRYTSDNCTVGFYYLMSDNIESRLKLEWRKPCYDMSAKFLWETTGREPLKWYHQVIELNVDSSFILVFTADVAEHAMEGIGVAIDDITFSPSCYSASHRGSNGKHHFDFEYEYEYSCGPDFFFSTCGAVGQKGPSQKLCNAEYKQSSRNISVQVEDGVQIWTIPETGVYSITAVGASGGLGTESGSELSRGGYVHGKFNFTSGTKLYLLVGQEGESACLKAGFESSSYCLMNTVKKNGTGERSPPVVRGGGGGGGGTFIYQRKPNGEIYPLIVAGGGSGLPYNQTDDVKMLSGGITISGSGLTGKSTDNMSGAGGGLHGSRDNTMTGQSLANGAEGGTGCTFTFVDKTWSTNGGFGGGGGGSLNLVSQVLN